MISNIADQKLFVVKAWLSRGRRKEVVEYLLPGASESELRKFMSRYVRAELWGYRIHDMTVRRVKE